MCYTINIEVLKMAKIIVNDHERYTMLPKDLTYNLASIRGDYTEHNGWSLGNISVVPNNDAKPGFVTIDLPRVRYDQAITGDDSVPHMRDIIVKVTARESLESWASVAREQARAGGYDEVETPILIGETTDGTVYSFPLIRRARVLSNEASQDYGKHQR
jgi:hypothetical protein